MTFLLMFLVFGILPLIILFAVLGATLSFLFEIILPLGVLIGFMRICSGCKKNKPLKRKYRKLQNQIMPTVVVDYNRLKKPLGFKNIEIDSKQMAQLLVDYPEAQDILSKVLMDTGLDIELTQVTTALKDSDVQAYFRSKDARSNPKFGAMVVIVTKVESILEQETSKLIRNKAMINKLSVENKITNYMTKE